MVQNRYLSYHRYAIRFLALFLLTMGFSCGLDDKHDITDGYIYISEGGKNNAIIKLPTTKEGKGINISCSIKDCNHNEDYITVLREVTEGFDCLWPEGNQGNDSNKLEYWIVKLKNNEVIGPLKYNQYEKKAKELQIPEKIMILK